MTWEPWVVAVVLLLALVMAGGGRKAIVGGWVQRNRRGDLVFKLSAVKRGRR